jgi:hypothetical protein
MCQADGPSSYKLPPLASQASSIHKKSKADTDSISIFMLEHLPVDQAIRLAILNLCVVLYDCGITKYTWVASCVCWACPMIKAAAHDDERLILDDDFVKYVEQINEPRPC